MPLRIPSRFVLILVASLTAMPASGQVVFDDFGDATLDPGWTLAGLGNANQQLATEADGVLSLEADGATAFYGADNAGFLYRRFAGNFRMEVDIDGEEMTTGGPYRKAGLMVRASLDPWSERLLALLVPYWQNGFDTHLQFVAREAYGEPGRLPVARDVVGVSRQLRLAIERIGQVFSVEYSLDDGRTWIRPTTGLGGTIEIASMPDELLVGLAMVSNDISVTSTAQFDDFSLVEPCRSAPQTILRASDPGDRQRFGTRLDVHGDTLLTTALYDNPIDTENQRGEVYVFERQAATGDWAEAQKLTLNIPSDQPEDDFFGIALELLDQDTAMVGSMNESAVHVYARQPSGVWIEQQLLSIPGHSRLGWSIAADGDWALIGSGLLGDGGTVQVFERDPMGSWHWRQEIAAPAASSNFGISLAVDGNRALIGAIDFELGRPVSARAHVFGREADDVWRLHQTLLPDAADDTLAVFGWSVDLDDSIAMVSALGTAVIAYELGFDGLWRPVQRIEGENGDVLPSGGFGIDLDLAGDRLLVGADRDTVPGLEWRKTGSAYVFTRNASDTWEQTRRIVADDATREAEFG
ncbi:MAG: hypothetical protein AAGE94_06070, partial [Acidobacteriota bacterium]